LYLTGITIHLRCVARNFTVGKFLSIIKGNTPDALTNDKLSAVLAAEGRFCTLMEQMRFELVSGAERWVRMGVGGQEQRTEVVVRPTRAVSLTFEILVCSAFS
jgi:hypothetical protein